MRKLLYQIKLPEREPPYYEAVVVENSIITQEFTADTYFNLEQKAFHHGFEDWELEYTGMERERR